MNKASNKYRVSVYLGKENYQQLEPMANMFGVSISAMVKIIFDTGMQIVKVTEKEIDKTMEGLVNNGKSKM